jgi:membrane protease YdiL (CAAX protease family)
LAIRIKNENALPAYFLIAFAFTWSFHIAIKFLGVPFTFDLTSPAMGLYLFGLLGPLVAAVLVSALLYGGAGVRALLAKGAKWRFPLRWYLVAIFSIPLLNLLNVVLFYDSVPPDMGWLVVVPVLIFGQIWVVIAEEFGWRGFALPRLQDRFGSLGASLILGPIWALWHLPMFFIEGSPQYSDNIPVSLAMYTVIITFTTIIFTMIYNRSGGSVLACMLLHAFFNIAAFTIQVPPDVNITALLIIALGVVSIWFLDRPFFGSTASNSDVAESSPEA